jgi:putative ABC transport system permease protein
MIAFGNGLQREFQNQVEALGANLVIAVPGKKEVNDQGGHGMSISFRSSKPVQFSEQDAGYVKKACPSVQAACPMLEGGVTVTYQGYEDAGQVEGVTETYPEVRKLQFESGGLFSADDIHSGTRVCVISSRIKEMLFGKEEAVGKKVLLNNSPYYVSGVLAKVGGMFGDESQRTVLTPYAAAKALTGQSRPGAVMAVARTTQEIDAAQAQMRRVIGAIHPNRDFDFITMKEISTFVNQFFLTMTLFLGGIAMVSLAVGGIGIMNIMLVSVTERTREIGIRKAIGAKGRDILLQFLIEAVVLCLVGGALALGLSYAIAAVVRSVTESLDLLITQSAVILAITFSTAVGVLFGVWPARRAARLDPIVALRYE